MGIITAHSGCDKTRDNSLGFIQYALDSEAECLEVDVRQNTDGELILSHDETGRECVRLEQAFALLAKRTGKKMNCDLKLKNLEIPVYRLAEEFHVEERLIYSGEVDVKLLDEKEMKFPKAEIYLNIENLYPGVYEEKDRLLLMERLKNALLEAKRYPVACINMEYHLFTEEVLSLFAALGLEGSAWTVNEENDLRRLLGRGISNITTRNLKKALKIRREAGE